ncbi:MAG: response regulator [Saprospiraceae bacterium]|nr:response regulator [Saprospiraceae bacterium]HMW38985.1 adenylate/guanylate cyclase domain-containing protein [Saprospiraceae bacterium]HMX87751.1 adenylate/guanylate cyclase domain-containing protein [Saprospiraceae bacterium]HMZ39327.1 adenylate/guanylate cyclase domain-containing protein [Saprospiraceae bacterium]HNA63643.1 adenylate/guanylate cyclase domain-containing protein [Saprospiraceae bacterium]
MERGVIICIDDEKLVLNGLKSQLGHEFGDHYDIEMAESGEEAIELLADLLDKKVYIPIVISDQLMPGIKGHELLIEVHKLSPSTYKILLTGQSDIEAITEAVNKANLYRYISKPWDGKDLTLTVREAIKGFYQDLQLENQNKLLERHNKELEKLVIERTAELQAEKEKSEALLVNILPEEIAKDLKEKGVSEPRFYEMVTVLFTDFQSFTQSATTISPVVLIQTLNEFFTAFDDIIDRNNLEKIKTIGDSYMCAGGLPTPNTSNPKDAVLAAKQITKWVNDKNAERQSKGLQKWEIRIGIHTGELIAGVIGRKKFAYDVWGNTVNLASRMESSGEIGKVNISNATYELIKDEFICEYRGNIPVKGNVSMEMYFLSTIDFQAMEAFVQHKLETQLPDHLSYHSMAHTKDVYKVAVEIATIESVDPYHLQLLKTAVLYHDLGFIVQATGHEEISCEIAHNTLPDFGYSQPEIERICDLIRATKIPQSPKNKLEEIICDADLDYLGRNDYESISTNLYHELNISNPISASDWLQIQIDFIEQHQYFTETSIRMRNEKKAEILESLKKQKENTKLRS